MEMDNVQKERLYAPNDEDTSEWILSDPWTHERIAPRNVIRLLVLCPCLQVLADKDDVISDPIDLGQSSFEDAFAQVLLVRFEELSFMVLDADIKRISMLCDCRISEYVAYAQ